jgi:hypothetical protein
LISIVENHDPKSLLLNPGCRSGPFLHHVRHITFAEAISFDYFSAHMLNSSFLPPSLPTPFVSAQSNASLYICHIPSFAALVIRQIMFHVEQLRYFFQQSFPLFSTYLAPLFTMLWKTPSSKGAVSIPSPLYFH